MLLTGRLVALLLSPTEQDATMWASLLLACSAVGLGSCGCGNTCTTRVVLRFGYPTSSLPSSSEGVSILPSTHRLSRPRTISDTGRPSSAALTRTARWRSSDVLTMIRRSPVIARPFVLRVTQNYSTCCDVVKPRHVSSGRSAFKLLRCISFELSVIAHVAHLSSFHTISSLRTAAPGHWIVYAEIVPLEWCFPHCSSSWT